jgi:heavy metal translocating P-type ATPase
METAAAQALRHELKEERAALKRNVVLTALTGAGLATGLLTPLVGLETYAGWAYLVAYLSGGFTASKDAATSLLKGKLNIDLLMVLAALAAAAVGEARDGAILLFLFQLAETLEDYAMGTTKRAVAGLMNLRPDEARRIVNGDEETVAVGELNIGDVVRVRAGERIPVDGRIDKGQAAIDQSTLTGESVPVDKKVGDDVFAGTVNENGTLEVTVGTEPEGSTLARMIDLVTEAQAAKAPSERISDWFGQRYTLGVLGGALLALLAFGWFGPSWDEAFYKTATLLVVASPCAVVISVPASVLSALAAAAKRGVLFKGGGALEAFGQVDTFAFDKTGTLTTGHMTLTSVHAFQGDEGDVLTRLASLERHSDHPLAVAIVEGARERGLTLSEPENVATTSGSGVEGTVDGHALWAGNPGMAQKRSLEVQGDHASLMDTLTARGETAILVGDEHAVHGVVGITDVPRSDATEAMSELRRSGVPQLAMLTGDHRNVAASVAKQIGLRDNEIEAELLPEQKVEHVRALQEQGRRVAFVGDGVNDAAALATANVGIAMGVAGSDVALETADVALLSGDLMRLPEAHRLAKRAQRIVRQNLAFALGVMAIMVVWTLVGDLPLPLGVLGHEGGTILVVANGLRLLIGESRRPGQGPGAGGTTAQGSPVQPVATA